MLDRKELIEEAVQASIDAGLAVNGEHGVAAARHAARFMFNALPAAARPAVTDEMVVAAEYAGDEQCKYLGIPCPQTSVYRAALHAALSAHPCTTSPVVDHETANVDGKPNVMTDALRELRGHIADVAAAGMLIGSNQNETFQRLQDKGKTMLAIVDTTLGAAGEPVAWQHRFRTGLNMDGEWGPWRYGRSKMHSIQSYYEERPLYAAPQGAGHDE